MVSTFESYIGLLVSARPRPWLSARRGLLLLLALAAAAGSPRGALAGPPLFDMPMSTVPGGGAGPAYTFEMGTFEVTNAQYAAFLNDAQRDGGATGRGSNMAFAANGVVTTPGGAVLASPNREFPDLTTPSRIFYDRSAPVGARYTVEPGFERHPVLYVSWLGALKFCNWLTLDQGAGAEQRAYTEGSALEDWHAVTISSTDWAARDLDDAERQTLVDTVRGYRLPMDNQGFDVGPPAFPLENAFNEWYKAAAYDPRAPDESRTSVFTGLTVAADHWIFGYGRDTFIDFEALANGIDDSVDANVSGFGPFGGDFPGTTPVGFYDGTDHRTSIHQSVLFNTNPNDNPYGIFDLIGNAFEWCQDRTEGGFLARVARGGSWKAPGFTRGRRPQPPVPFLDNTARGQFGAETVDELVGFRVLHVPSPLELPAPACDFDFDGDVDLADYLTVQACFSGAGVPVAPDCDRADLDHDGDVDLADLLEVQSHFTGSR